jgi:hypothetical protein
LPEAPASAVLFGAAEWKEGLESAGVNVLEPGEGSPTLAVASRAEAAAAAAAGAPVVLVEGRRASPILARSYPVVDRYLPIPGLDAPQLIVPLSHQLSFDYAVRNWSLGESMRRRLRNALARHLLKWGAFPEVRSLVTVGTKHKSNPFLVQAVEPLGVPAGCQWFLTLGHGDPLTRAVFHLFPPEASDPQWVLKFTRVPGYADAFDRDERGLRVAAAAGGAVTQRAPRLLGRIEAAGLPAALETAAVGTRFTLFLQGHAQEARKLRAIESVAEWTIEAARETAAPSDRLESERQRLGQEVLPAWRGLGVPGDLVERVSDVPAVLQHNDLGSWNVIMRSESDFTAVDWESARAEGFPLWDLVYFLTDAIIHLDGASQPNLRDAHNLRLFRGELPSSAILFGWVRRYCEALSIPDEDVGPVVTLCWLHHGMSGGRRRVAVEAYSSGSPVGEIADAERIARLWLTSPGLGPSWDARRRG